MTKNESELLDNPEVCEKNTSIKKDAIKKIKSKNIDTSFYLEYQGNQISEEDILSKFIAEWKKEKKLSEIKDLDIYLKVEENVAFCLVNKKETIAVKLY